MAKIADQLILVTGATGKQGGAVFRHLKQRGFPLRVLVRDPDHPSARALLLPDTEVVQGDLNDPGFGFARAMDGVYGVFSVQASHQEGGAETEIRQGISVSEEARRAGVRHLVYNSVASADQNTGIAHFDSKFKIEEHIQSAGVPYTILRPVFFMENWLGMRPQLEQGTLALPLKPETRLQMIAVDDIGAFAAMAFEHSGLWQNRIFELAGDELSIKQVIDDVTRMETRPVHYVQLAWEDFERKAGAEMTAMWKWFESTGYHVDIAEVRREYPRLTSFERWMRAALTAA